MSPQRAFHERAIEILLVEDNEADIRLTREVLADGRYLNSLHVARDGEEAMEYLRRRGRYEGSPRPDIILLDLNLPRKDGREVLAELKADEELRRIPVVILTTSRAEADVLNTYSHFANCYIVKPVDLSQFIAVVRSIEDFWLRIVCLPKSAS
jgi:chemotaxis family two-component system response regulator Rcp1